MYGIKRTRQAKKDVEACRRAGFKPQLDKIIETLKKNPFEPTQHFERLAGNLNGYCSRQIDYHNRVLYEVAPNDKNLKDENGKPYDGIVLVYEAWKHRYKRPK